MEENMFYDRLHFLEATYEKKTKMQNLSVHSFPP